jgi:hypothetical protein
VRARKRVYPLLGIAQSATRLITRCATGGRSAGGRRLCSRNPRGCGSFGRGQARSGAARRQRPALRQRSPFRGIRNRYRLPITCYPSTHHPHETRPRGVHKLAQRVGPNKSNRRRRRTGNRQAAAASEQVSTARVAEADGYADPSLLAPPRTGTLPRLGRDLVLVNEAAEPVAMPKPKEVATRRR